MFSLLKQKLHRYSFYLNSKEVLKNFDYKLDAKEADVIQQKLKKENIEVKSFGNCVSDNLPRIAYGQQFQIDKATQEIKTYAKILTDVTHIPFSVDIQPKSYHHNKPAAYISLMHANEKNKKYIRYEYKT